MDRTVTPVSATSGSLAVKWNDGDGFVHQEAISCFEMRGLAVRARRKIARGGGYISFANSKDMKKWAEQLRKWHLEMVPNGSWTPASATATAP